MPSGVYSIQCLPISARFIGVAKNIEKQWKVTRQLLDTGKWFSGTDKKIIGDWQTHGSSNFSWEILEEIPLDTYIKSRFKRFQHWVDVLNPSYNEFRGLPKTCGIYVIENTVSDECYVGASVNIHKRIEGHLNCLRGGYHSSRPLLQSYQQHGEEAFTWKILQTCEKDQCLQLEKEWAHKLNASLNAFQATNRDGVIIWQRRVPS
ncbi:GIY-YIG nuclease family protein [Nostoc sp.]|uniref:GIY-YIG nuclease family protein n=1 Tax=Nostoc sp. TaxID=1180 RepID=UPI002FFA910E